MKNICTGAERFFNINRKIFRFFSLFPSHHTIIHPLRQEKNAAAFLPPQELLLLAEGLAVGALVLGGVVFVGTHQDPVQGAVVLGIAVVSAGLDGAFNALVCMTVHFSSSFLFGTALVWPKAK